MLWRRCCRLRQRRDRCEQGRRRQSKSFSLGNQPERVDTVPATPQFRRSIYVAFRLGSAICPRFSVSSDVFKQPVTIVVAVVALLWMDWRFTLVSLILFPFCIVPIRIFGRRARQGVQLDQRGSGLMSVTMQESFAGIRVIKSFAREEQQEKAFRRSSQLSFSNTMRVVKATEAVGPLVEIIASAGVGLALFYVYAANLSAGRFLGLMAGIFILYEPIKTLSKLHIVMQRSLGATTQIFSILDSKPEVQDAPNAI